MQCALCTLEVLFGITDVVDIVYGVVGLAEMFWAIAIDIILNLAKSIGDIPWDGENGNLELPEGD